MVFGSGLVGELRPWATVILSIPMVCDPWFKKNLSLKTLKKQFYWWLKQGSILRDADAVCFTTEEERLLAQRLFSLSGKGSGYGTGRDYPT